MIIYPAIDIRGGRAVRLLRGDYDRETAYDADPVEAARRWVEQGARFLHVVDLDGAKEGLPANLEHVRRIIDSVDVPVQVGGGLRKADAVTELLSAGAARAVLGSAAQADPDLVEALVSAHGEAIVVSLDARGGQVAVSGWTERTDTEAVELLRELAGRGVERFVYTPVEVDGTLEGPALAELRALAEPVRGELIYSGGIGSLDHLRALAGLGLPSLGGVIVGRALYEGRFTVAEGQSALAG